MLIVDFFLIAFALTECTTYIRQLQHNKSKKSVYGSSFDFFLLNYIGFLTRTIYSLFHAVNVTCQLQYARRFPVHPRINVNMVVLAIDCVTSVVSFGIMLQFFHYRKTRNIYQGLSPFAAAVCAVFLLLFLYVLYCCVKSRLKIVFLDVIDTLWLISTCANTFKLIPQVWINFLARCTLGLDLWFLPLQLMAATFMSCSVVNNLNWWEAPVNMNSWWSLYVYMGMLLLLSAQGYIYKSNKPTAIFYQEV